MAVVYYHLYKLMAFVDGLVELWAITAAMQLWWNIFTANLQMEKQSISRPVLSICRPEKRSVTRPELSFCRREKRSISPVLSICRWRSDPFYDLCCQFADGEAIHFTTCVVNLQMEKRSISQPVLSICRQRSDPFHNLCCQFADGEAIHFTTCVVNLQMEKRSISRPVLSICRWRSDPFPVSYTHLTLPTKRIV